MWNPSIQLRISRPMSGDVDGVDLARFMPGHVYPLSPTLAAFVVAIRAGEPLVDRDGSESRDTPPRLFMTPEPRSSIYWNGRERRQERR